MKSFLLKMFLIGFVLNLVASNWAKGQVEINEIAPSNISFLQNSNGKYDDWIELYNAGTMDADLSGYGLTDDLSRPFLFKFPSHILPAGEKMIVFASDTNVFAIDHYEMAVNGTGSWMYVLGSSSLDTNWRNPGFNDASWNTGNGGIGFSDDDDGTVIPPNISVMMRQSFFIADTSAILKAIFMIDYDDGYVAYLNGVEISRANMATTTGRPVWDELAPQPHEAQLFAGNRPDSLEIDREFFKSIIKQGINVFAVETHDRVPVPTDMSSIPFLFLGMQNSNSVFPPPPVWFVAPPNEYYNAKFKLARTGETIYFINPSGGFYDQVTYPALEADNSYARVPDGYSNWCYLETPTPLLPNNSSTCNTGYATIPVFSKSAGYYSNTLSLGLSTNFPGGVIRYTTNGDIPDSTSFLYSGLISLDSTVTIRARVFALGTLSSPVITNTYFINETNHLPVFCITTDSLNLWDYNTGIYTWGPNADSIFPYYNANFWQPWSKPASIEYFDKLGSRVINFNADIEIYGNYSRYRPQKSFEIKLSDKHGLSEVNYPFLPDKPYLTTFENILLRNAGTDWNFVHFRDALMQRIMKNTYSGYVAAEPVVGYLNGSFWGVYILNEKYNKKWVELNYGLKKGEFDFCEEIGDEIFALEGTSEDFFDLYNFATTESPLSTGFYDQLKDKLDLQNFADYFIANTYYNNGDWLGDWTNNIRIWNAEKHDTRIKYLLIDTDFGFGLRGNLHDNRLSEAINPVAFSHTSNIFDATLKNPVFKRYFINRYADLINTIYLPTNVNAVMKQFRDSMRFDMGKHFTKWGSDTTSWNTRINDMMSWVSQRPAIMRNYIRNEFNLDGEVMLSVNTFPSGSGRIEISTVIPESYPWTGVYFNGNPVTITAIANPGYTFDHWHSNVVISANDTNLRTTYNFTSNDAITAYFTGSPAPIKLAVSEINYNSVAEFDVNDWIEFYNYGTFAIDISGWKLSDEEDRHQFVFPSGSVISPGGYLVVPEDSIKLKTFFPDVVNRTGQMDFSLNNSGDQIRLFDYLGNQYLSFYFSDQNPWPLQADGLGYTCELLSTSGNLGDGANWFAGCYGGSPGKAYSTTLSAPVTINGNRQYCIGDSTELSLLDLPVYSYQWLLNDNVLLGDTTNSIVTFTPGIYTVLVDAQGCSASSPPATIEEVNYSAEPSVTDGARCRQGSVLLFASSSEQVSWYDAAQGNLLGVGDSFVTPMLSETTTFFVRAGQLCKSEAVKVTAHINKDACGDSLLVYPNPSSTKNLSIQSYYLDPGTATILLNDMSGKTVLSQAIIIQQTGRSRELELDNINSGVYILTVTQGDKKLTTKYVRL